MNFLCRTVCKYIIGPSLLSAAPSHQVSGPLAIVSPGDGSPLLTTTSLTGERVAGTGTSLSDWTGGRPSGQEQNREAKEGKTLHPVRPRPSLLLTGRPAEPPLKQPLGPSVFRCDRAQTKEREILEPDSIHHNLSPRRPTLRGAATYRSLGGHKQTFFSGQLLDRLVVLRLAQLAA